MAKTKGLNLSSVEADGMTLKQRAAHYYWGDNAGHPAFRHAMSIRTVRKLTDDGALKRDTISLMREHKIYREAIESFLNAAANGESTFFEVFADAIRRMKSPEPAHNIRWEAARYVLECEARGTIATRESTIRNVKERLGTGYLKGVESAIDRMKLFAQVKPAKFETIHSEPQ